MNNQSQGKAVGWCDLGWQLQQGLDMAETVAPHQAQAVDIPAACAPLNTSSSDKSVRRQTPSKSLNSKSKEDFTHL